ncbi:MAG: hydrogenase formation protein HypD [Elusimicrobiaceae bacterium]|nr:hydrogenase formation protein HypD [Elusimicrobiaceae bacterium]
MTGSGHIFEDSALALKMAERAHLLAGRIGRPVSLMEVCGTHTMSIARAGLRRLLPRNMKLLSGPGCPVCVTPPGVIDGILSVARTPGVIITAFGDMLKVRGACASLEDCRRSGAQVQIIYSAQDALETARQNPRNRVVFAGAGFETTTPSAALAVMQARDEKLENFSVYPAFKLVPPALRALLENKTELDGFLLPGHVSSVIGLAPYSFVAGEFKKPCVVAGFEALDILHAVNLLLEQILAGEPKVENAYPRAVRAQGNPEATRVTNAVFTAATARWRAIGDIPLSGLAFRPDWSAFDARTVFEISEPDTPEPPGCLCGAVITGRAAPSDCPLFRTACTPADAKGPCMVSSEGACAAWYRYGDPL